MFSGYYTIASGLISSQRNIDTIGNNLINIDTPGYRSEKLVFSAFEQELMSRLDSSGKQVLGDGIGSTIALVYGSTTQFKTGLIEETGRNLDVAINGEGFFNIIGAGGNTYLTRNGSFDIDNEGYLVLPGVGRVQGQNGAIHVGTSEITILDDGTVINAQEAVLGRILITAPDDYSVLERASNGLFISPNQLNASNNYQLIQKTIEKSNVDMNVELTNLIAAQRNLQSCASALKIIDSINQKAASQIASI